MRQKIEAYIKKYHNCQKNKHATHAKYEEIQYQKSSIASWNKIIMNFIIKLSKSKNSTSDAIYDLILVIINRLIKYSHLISFKKEYTTKQLNFVVLNKLIRYHEIFLKITSDRDKLFTFNYWRTLIILLRIKLKLSTIYHSQIND